MKKIFTFLFVSLFVVGAIAQETGVIMKASVAPEIDGVMEEVWNEAEVYDIANPYRTETPSIGEVGESTWRGLWNDDGLFIFLTINDNVWYPSYLVEGSNNWEYDKPELYFDVNYELEDGLGAQHNQGHYQVAPAAEEAKIDGTPTTQDNGVIYAFNVTDPAYMVEYFVPWTLLNDKDGVAFDKTGTMGFDVTIIDRDGAEDTRQRAVWSNIGTFDESWSNMNEAGRITLDNVGEIIYIDQITLTGGDITTDNGTVQIEATITPDNATNKNLRWSVENKTGRATISNTGLVTGVMDGLVTVTADAIDGSFERATIDVNISGQIPTADELNIIKNGNFSQTDANNAPLNWNNGWIDTGYGNPAVVQDGAAVLEVLMMHETEAWHYQFSQTGFKATPDIPYEFSFVAWASEPRVITVDFEDTSGNNYNRYGASPTGKEGRSEWDVDLTTEAQKFTFEVTFDQIVESTVEKVQFMVSQAVGMVYIDSVMLISEADLALIPDDFQVTFNVDMTRAAEFDPATDTVYVTGSMFEWAEPGTMMEEQMMTRVEESMIYTKTLTLAPGEYQYKFFLNAGWEGGEWEGDPNRMLTVAGPVTVNDFWNSQVNVDAPELASINIYPSPAREFFTITSGSNIRQVVIADLTGKTVYSNDVNHTQLRVNNNFDNGIYIVRIYTDEGMSVSKLQLLK